MPYSLVPTLVVLDTNVCLDLFVFHDPRWKHLLDALKNKTIQAVTREDCRKEWQVVLTYPHLSLDEASRLQTAAEFDRLIACHSSKTDQFREVRLPLCSDPDDQKFLELAYDANAAALITKDKALLKLARKTAQARLFQILLPEAWIKLTMASLTENVLTP